MAQLVILLLLPPRGRGLQVCVTTPGFCSTILQFVLSSIFIYQNDLNCAILNPPCHVVGRKVNKKQQEWSKRPKGRSPSSQCADFALLDPVFPGISPGGRRRVFSLGSLCRQNGPLSLPELCPLWLSVQPILTLPGVTRLSMPMRSFLSSCSFWQFSILIMVPCSCATISVISASAAAGRRGALEVDGSRGPCPNACSPLSLGKGLLLPQHNQQ